MVSEAQTQAGRDWLSFKTQKRAERQKKIIRFLRLNPDSTSDEVWAACNASVDDIPKFFKRHKRKSDNRMVYRIDEKKFAAYFQ